MIMGAIVSIRFECQSIVVFQDGSESIVHSVEDPVESGMGCVSHESGAHELTTAGV
jgi:hypothetical protein